MTRWKSAFLVLGALAQLERGESAPCPNGCSGHGRCELSSTGGASCVCVRGWDTAEGPDCSLRECPKGIAWWDFATADDTAHAEAECSNMGICDRATGVCECKTGFEGPACERLSCPTSAAGSCSGHGRCITMRDAAENTDEYRLKTTTTYDVWDADKIQGCVCEHGYKGYDCSLRECPTGTDPLAVSSKEIQVVNCLCQTTCSGYFYLGFRSRFAKISHDFQAADIKAALENLSTIRGVTITIHGGSTICDNAGSSTEIQFDQLPGDLPDFSIPEGYTSTLTSTGTVTLTLSTGGTAGTYGGSSADGVGAISECSSRGYCNDVLGTCVCNAGSLFGGTFGSSDGETNSGSQPNCGHVLVSPTSCPQGDDGDGNIVECAGHGTCTGASSYTCTCQSGFTGADCSYFSCPTGTAWFDEASAPNTAHAIAECSNMGHCNRGDGVCACREGFAGDACEKLSCPMNEDSVECSGHGTCYSMKSLALLSEENGVLRQVTYGDVPTVQTWDHSSIYGCYCDRDYYHGPYARGYSDFTASYDCSLMSCAKGDNPQTLSQVNEVQTIDCIATGGVFTVTFREDTTLEIPFSATESVFQHALESLITITGVSVSYSSGTAACKSSPGNKITIKFFEPGDLPLIEVDDSSLTGATVIISETVAGTTESIQCSGQGTCDSITGICGCYHGYASSDGSGDGVTVGQRGDCGAMYLFSPVIVDETAAV